jgi:dinuclear metal center YbgI/SA1388 family protein
MQNKNLLFYVCAILISIKYCVTKKLDNNLLKEFCLMKIREFKKYLNTLFPLALQEEYDNSGLQIGDPEEEIKGILITVDVTEEIIDEAIDRKANFILSHHPLFFTDIKKLSTGTYVERVARKAIKNNIAVYSAHTNLDKHKEGINMKLAQKLGLENIQVLDPVRNQLIKLAFFVPHEHANEVRKAVFDAGAGQIGDYDQCSYNLQGEGTFRPGEGTDPFVGNKGEMHFEKETRVETIFPSYLTQLVMEALFKAHPYEEVAYDLYPLLNTNNESGLGAVGEFENPVSETDFLTKLKETFKIPCIKHTEMLNKPIQKVALCGGSGSSLLEKAKSAGADVFVSADFKYHRYFDAENSIMIVDIGHYESENIAKKIFYELLTKNFPNFAIHLSEVNTNPINYY